MKQYWLQLIYDFMGGHICKNVYVPAFCFVLYNYNFIKLNAYNKYYIPEKMTHVYFTYGYAIRDCLSIKKSVSGS